MKNPVLAAVAALLFLLSSAPSLFAIPSSFFGNGPFIVLPPHPRFNSDLTGEVLSAAHWQSGEFSGPWEDVPALPGQSARRMTASPVLFGAHPDSVYAYSEDDRLREIVITYLDAGTFFGFKFGGERTPTDREEGSERRLDFAHVYQLLSRDLRSRLEQGCGRGRQVILGRSDALRTVFTDYVWDGFVIRLAMRDGHSITLHVVGEGDEKRGFFDPDVAALTAKERSQLFAANARRTERGDILVHNIPMFTQSNTPFCGIHSLAMAGHYYGLRLRPDGLAAAAEFKNTGSARGSRILDLYHAAAEEVDMRLQVSSRFDFDRVQRSIASGMPVLVWRRVSMEREEAHARVAARLAANPLAALPEPSASQRATWPERDKSGSPSHASVISGVNPRLREVVFTEPWGEHARNRRMGAEEMEATVYAVFYFRF